MKRRYLVNENNQLEISSAGKGPVALKGEFGSDSRNRLVYWLNEPFYRRKEMHLPARMTFEGRWRVNPNHDLEYILSGTKEQSAGEPLLLRGRILDADNDSLTFVLGSISGKGFTASRHLRLFKLSGNWQANEQNCIAFCVDRKTSPDRLIFSPLWQVDKNQEIVYIYEKRELKKRSRSLQGFAFKGFWQIDRKNRLSYVLERGVNSRFDFRAQVQSPNLLPQQGVIKYRLGAGIGNSQAQKDIFLYGGWKFSRKLGVSFEMTYSQKKVRAIEFETDIYLTDRDTVSISLLNKKRQQLGLNISLRRKFLREQGAELLLRLKKDSREGLLQGEVRIPF